jgi:hypothetical protein
MSITTRRSRTLPACRLSETPYKCPYPSRLQRWRISPRTGSMWLRLIIAAVVCSLVATSRAEVFERDWKEPGDGLLTYDNVNHREWLDLSETLLEQFAEPGAEFPEDHYANVIAELGLGGLFEGFTVAKSEDVIALAASAGIDPSTGDFQINSPPMSRLMELLDVTVHFTNTDFMRSQGFLDEFSANQGTRCPCRAAGVLQLAPPVSPNDSGRAVLWFGAPDDLFEPSTMGVMLHRPAVPEPSSVGLGLACISVAIAAAYCKSPSHSR